MAVIEQQKLGALALLALCLLYYAISLVDAGQPALEPAIPWGRQEPGSLTVGVSGGRAEGIYFIPRGTRFAQLPEIVGIPEIAAGLHSREQRVPDGALLSISSAGVITVGEMGAATRLALGLRLDLNRASAEDLLLVPGIGERMAAQIINLRLERGGFGDIADLLALPGIKEKRLKNLAGYLMVGPEGPGAI